MLNRPRFIGNRGLDIQLTPVDPPLIKRTQAFVYEILRQDRDYNLSNHYVEVFVNGRYLRDFQGHNLNLKHFQDLVSSPFFEYRVGEEWYMIKSFKETVPAISPYRAVEIRIEEGWIQWIYQDALEEELEEGMSHVWYNLIEITELEGEPEEIRINNDQDYLELKFRAKRIVHGYNHYSETDVVLKDYNIVASETTFCSEYLKVSF